ncbi:hypothetical protein A1OE_159 [Candidatus Endolissoclinum faulkneri L2]|uniref:Uncharacterized protein n=1 Tax=Candidatus Endolissoclinum faulkneri L2 TaxID=1193729 RepID=K7Z321_9PROT|nr:hypothetical protein A1OE_159 [Candidatus Endolissoclinum faulkneri L2]
MANYCSIYNGVCICLIFRSFFLNFLQLRYCILTKIILAYSVLF